MIFEAAGTTAKADFERWVQQLLWDRVMSPRAGQLMEIMRIKGVVSLEGEGSRHILQGVQQLYDLTETTAWEAAEARTCRVLLVGRYLDEDVLRKTFAQETRLNQFV